LVAGNTVDGGLLGSHGDQYVVELEDFTAVDADGYVTGRRSIRRVREIGGDGESVITLGAV